MLQHRAACIGRWEEDINMKKSSFLLALCMFLTLSSCSTADNENSNEPSLFLEVILSHENVSIAGLSGGMSFNELMTQEGLTKDDVQITDGLDSSTTKYVVSEGWTYLEGASSLVTKRYYFNDDKLTVVEYLIPFWNVSYDKALTASVAIFDTVERLAGDAESLEHGDKEALSELGGRYGKQFMIDSKPIFVGIHYQDLSGAEFTDADEVVIFSLYVPL